MVERGWGRVQFVSSESALQIPKEMVHYGMTKTALLAVSRGMAESVPASGVTINCLLPGPTLTEGVAQMLGGATPEEVANLSVYLASEQASATTGAAVRVDGGVVRAAIG